MDRPIESFDGKNRFLSNFYDAEIELDDETYRSVEHAYQAAKFPQSKRAPFRKEGLRAAQAKALGKGKGGPGWPRKSLPVMLELLRQKFHQPVFRKMLLDTGESELIEGNWWGDTFFGVCEGIGENHLGKLLMQVRTELRNETVA